MMIQDKSFGRALLLALGVFLVTSASAQQPQQAPQAPQAQQTHRMAQPPKRAKSARKATTPVAAMVLEPRAIDILKPAGDRLAAARTMKFTAMVSYESPSRMGPP